MSLVSGLFTLPIVQTYLLYNQLTFELPLFRENLFSEPNFLYKNDPGYEECLEAVKHQEISQLMQDHLSNYNVRDDIKFIEQKNPGLCMAIGTHQSNDAVILIGPDLYEADASATSWIAKHEIAHIKHNDLFTMHAIPLICHLAASIFGMMSLSFWPAIGTTFLASIVANAVIFQWREAKADDFAIQNSDDNELKGARRFFIALQETYREQRDTILQQIAVAANGDHRLDILHPPISSRLQKIETVLTERGINFNQTDEGELQHIAALKRAINGN